ncbi:MAG: nicotinate-nucleotide--dimethylbenzimidazole phosphoribosyltransferase, partial [Verrucomicrobiae bacterium]|nr:nicotinate-nucleotide--dimethylbenzimidazole phosphoribosyltransferase [Verrucomicrobiae bacterium]
MPPLLPSEISRLLDGKTKPPGSLGLLESLAAQLARIQNAPNPKIIRPTILVFAADHGITAEGVSPYPSEVTAQMVHNFLGGGAAINVFCRQNGLALKIIDAGVRADFPDHPALVPAKIARGTANCVHAPAMSQAQLSEALDRGGQIAEEISREGCNAVGFGEMGIGNTSSAALLMHRFCHLPLTDCVGRGTGLDDAGVERKLRVLEKAAALHQKAQSPHEILAALGGFEIAMMCGAMLRAEERGLLLVMDGFVSTAALLAAHAVRPAILDSCVFAHVSDERGHRKMLGFLEATPLLQLGMRLGEGTGAALAFPLIQAAANFLNEMASF